MKQSEWKLTVIHLHLYLIRVGWSRVKKTAKLFENPRHGVKLTEKETWFLLTHWISRKEAYFSGLTNLGFTWCATVAQKWVWLDLNLLSTFHPSRMTSCCAVAVGSLQAVCLSLHLNFPLYYTCKVPSFGGARKLFKNSLLGISLSSNSLNPEVYSAVFSFLSPGICLFIFVPTWDEIWSSGLRKEKKSQSAEEIAADLC